MKTIILSAGHGGSDPGAVANKLQEKTFNLNCVLACKKHLEQNYSGHRLVLPRDRDIFVSLPARRDLTKLVNADLYVSFHANSFRTPAANGFETFVHSGPLYQRTLDHRKDIHDAVYSYMRTLGIFDRGMKRYDHWVTRNMPCPTVLLEYFFVSNPQEAVYGKSQIHVEKMGVATAEGIAKALQLPKKEEEPTPPDVWYRVVAGSYTKRLNAESVRDELIKLGYQAFIETTKGGN